MQFHQVSESSESDSEDQDEDSDAAPDRWQQPNSLEMDCVFLDDEDK